MSGARAYHPRRAARGCNLDVRGLRMHVNAFGPPAGERHPVRVFLHGFLDTGSTFQFLVDAFALDCAIAAPDFRGFGASEWAPGGYWFPDYVADLDALLAQLSPTEPVDLVGHSMGGNIAGLYAGARPDRVKSVVSLEGFGLPNVPTSEAPVRMARWLREVTASESWNSYDSFAALAAVIQARNPTLQPERAAFIANEWAQPTQDGRVMLRADPNHRRVNPVVYRREEAELLWRGIKAPMLLLIGTNSDLLRKLGADGTHIALQRSFPSARVVEVPEATHMMHWDRAAAIAPLIESFWREIASG